MSAIQRVYVDQLHLRPSPTSVLPALRARARSGALRAPISLPHVIETFMAHPDLRADIQKSLLELSAGEVLRTELSIALFEARAAREQLGIGWVAANAVTDTVWDFGMRVHAPLWLRAAHRLAPGRPEQLFRRTSFIGDSRAIIEKVGPILEQGALRANAGRHSLPNWQAMIRDLGAEDVARGRSEEELRLLFRSHASRRALQDAIWAARPKGMEPNDQVDIFFLAVALPYLDAVCVDRKMYARIEEARKVVGIPWAPAFQKLPDLLDWLGQP